MSKRSDLEDKLDTVFSQFIRLNNADECGRISCYCCYASIPWKQAEAMHYFGRSNTNTRWIPMNVHSGCHNCNVNLNGNLKVYARNLKKEYGDTAIDVLTTLKNTVAKFTNYEIEGMIIHYRNEVKKLRKEKGL